MDTFLDIAKDTVATLAKSSYVQESLGQYSNVGRYVDTLAVLANLPWSLLNEQFTPDWGSEMLLERIQVTRAWEKRAANGDLVFHRPMRSEALNLLLAVAPSSILEERDEQGFTPLMLAARRGDLDNAISYLAHGANPDARDPEGRGALHMAVVENEPLLVKALLLFGAYPHLRTKDGRDPLQLRDDVRRQDQGKRISMESVMEREAREEIDAAFALQRDDVDGIKEDVVTGSDRHYYARALESWTSGENRRNLLSLDGGGIRGLVLIQTLAELERTFGLPILDKFQWYSGTSTGAILALALARGKSTTECLRLYFRLKDAVFSGSPPYSPTALEKLLKTELGDGTMDEIKGKRVVVTSCDARELPPRLQLFRNYNVPPARDFDRNLTLDDPKNVKVWWAARCSSAAPFYFPPVDWRFVDGGLKANNPIGILLNEFSAVNTERSIKKLPLNKLGVVLSLGTGRKQAGRLDDGVTLEIKKGKPLESARTVKMLLQMLVEEITASDGEVVDHARSTTHVQGGAFFRLSPTFYEAIDLAETNNAILIEMLWDTKMNFLNNLKTLASNEAVQNFVKITPLTPAKLKEMEKIDRLSGFSAYFDRKADVHHVVLLVEPPLSVWSGADALTAKRIATMIDPMADITQEPKDAVRRERLKLLFALLASPRTGDWSPVHLASGCGFVIALKQICARDAVVSTNHATHSGLLPLHIAVEAGQIEAVRFLVGAGALQSKGDSNGRTPLHYSAALEDPKILELLLSSPSSSAAVNVADGDGQTALFMALKAGRGTSVARLLHHGAKTTVEGQPLLFALVGAEYTPGMNDALTLVLQKGPQIVEEKNAAGATILHVRLEKNVLSALLSLLPPTSLSAPDSRGLPPLVLAASRSDLDAVVLFLSYDAPPDAVDAEGNTALHQAVIAGDALSTKALLLFGASPNIKNKLGNDASALCKNVNISHALRLAAGQMLAGMQEEAIGDLEIFRLERALMHAEKGALNLLSLDGGGIRGLVLIELLAALEHSLGEPLLSRFSWLAGTSTGAILALALAQGKTVAQCRKLYFRFKDRVFFGRRPYSEKMLEEFLKKEYGAQATMASFKDKRVVVTTCIGTVCPPELHLYRSYKAPLIESELLRLGYGDPARTAVWYAARCSSAAPTYFSAVEGKWMDGGLVANNPIGELMQDVCTESDAREMSGQAPVRVGCVLSLGTGARRAQSVENLQLELPSGIMSGITSLWASFETLKHLKNVLVEQIVRADGPIVERARAWSASKNAAFFRFTPTFAEEIMLDETTNAVLIEMMWNTKIYMRTQSAFVERFKRYLDATK